MARSRTYLHLALAVTLLSLTCDLGAVCAFAGMEGECCCPMKMEGGSSPCMDMSGDDRPDAHDPEAAIESSERFSAAVLEAAPSIASCGDPTAVTGISLADAPPAAPTPLYLSHCAFLC